jgi:hypothetical protein
MVKKSTRDALFGLAYKFDESAVVCLSQSDLHIQEYKYCTQSRHCILAKQDLALETVFMKIY